MPVEPWVLLKFVILRVILVSGKSTVAAWKQAARAELAATLGTSYGQVLLDLVKAFERIPHWV